jgi:hypothetical protein
VQGIVDRVVGKQLDLPSIERAVEMGGEGGHPDAGALHHRQSGVRTRRDINGTLDYALRLHERHGVWPSVPVRDAAAGDPARGTRGGRPGPVSRSSTISVRCFSSGR